MNTHICTDAQSYVQAHTKSLQLKPTCPSLLTEEDSPSCVYSVVFPFDLCLFLVFLIDWILALLRAACSLPCLQLHNCIQRSLLGWLGCNWFQQLWVGVRLPCNPSCLLSPVLSSATHTTWDCFILLVETLPCRCLRILPFALPPGSHTSGIAALLQLHAAATAATLEQIFCSVTRVRAQRGKIPLCFPETGHAAPAAGLRPVP